MSDVSTQLRVPPSGVGARLRVRTPAAAGIRGRVRSLFTIGGDPDRLPLVILRGVVVAMSALFVVGLVELVLSPRWETHVMPVTLLVMIAWSIEMLRRGRPRPVPVLLLGGLVAATFTFTGAALGDHHAIPLSGPLMVVAGVGTAIMAASTQSQYVVGGALAALIGTLGWVMERSLGVPMGTAIVDSVTGFVVVSGAFILVTLVRRTSDRALTTIQTLLDAAPVAMFEADLTGLGVRGDPRRPARLVRLNSHASNMFGIPSADLFDPGRFRQEQPETADEIGRLFHEVLSGTGAGSRVVRLSEHAKSYQVAWRVLDRRFERVIFSAVDATREQEERDRLAEEMSAKNQLMATVSHELRTPLTTVSGILQLVAERGCADRELDDLVRMALDNARDMTDISSDLSVAARAGTDDISVRCEATDVVALVKVATAPLESEFSLELPPVLVAVADPVRVRQIVRNLATNAVRYGGSRRRVVAGNSDDLIHIEFRDDGRPLSHEVAARIFDPYQRQDRPDRPRESIGIGLTVARTLARAMGGDVSYGHDGRETVFTLSLPTPA